MARESVTYKVALLKSMVPIIMFELPQPSDIEYWNYMKRSLRSGDNFASPQDR